MVVDGSNRVPSDMHDYAKLIHPNTPMHQKDYILMQPSMVQKPVTVVPSHYNVPSTQISPLPTIESTVHQVGNYTLEVFFLGLDYKHNQREPHLSSLHAYPRKHQCEAE